MESQTHLQGLAATRQASPILVVDDDMHLRQMLRWVLEDEGFEVKTAADGQDAEKSRQIGAISFLRKPFEIDELVSAVQQACSL